MWCGLDLHCAVFSSSFVKKHFDDQKVDKKWAEKRRFLSLHLNDLGYSNSFGGA